MAMCVNGLGEPTRVKERCCGQVAVGPDHQGRQRTVAGPLCCSMITCTIKRRKSGVEQENGRLCFPSEGRAYEVGVLYNLAHV